MPPHPGCSAKRNPSYTALDANPEVPFVMFPVLLLSCSMILLGEPPAAPAKAAPKPPRTAVRTGAPIKPLELNLATKEELMRLPGVDDLMADRIIAGRPYRVRTNLITRGIMPRSLYSVLRPLVSAQQPPPSK